MEESNRTLVLEAPYAGIIPRGWHVLERSERDFEKAGRILVPNLNDWTQTGKVLARLANKYDYEKIGQGRLTTDALIAMSAACGSPACPTTRQEIRSDSSRLSGGF